MRRRGVVLGVLAGCVLALVAAASASAGVDHWFSGNLGSGFAYGSASAHSTLSFIEGDISSPDAFCVEREQGYAGLVGPFTYVFGPGCTVGGTRATISYTPNGQFYHATIENGSSGTINVTTATHYDW
jgi:hypothetical protein